MYDSEYPIGRTAVAIVIIAGRSILWNSIQSKKCAMLVGKNKLK